MMIPESLIFQEVYRQLAAEIKALRVAIDASINEAGQLADVLSGDDGTLTAGVHGLQMCYDRLIEAKMWAGRSLGEIGHKLPEEYRDEAREGSNKE